jgi:3-methyladenine DNA glycosylase AlkD
MKLGLSNANKTKNKSVKEGRKEMRRINVKRLGIDVAKAQKISKPFHRRISSRDMETENTHRDCGGMSETARG